MNYYDDNLNALKTSHKAIYQAIASLQDDGSVYVGDAMNGEPFMAIIHGEEIIPLSSSYNPAHEAERFMMQFEEAMDQLHVILYGFGSGQIVRHILGNEELFCECVVYEPSLMILLKAMQSYDLTDILGNSGLHIFVADINDNEFYPYLDDTMDYLNWEYYRYVCLPKYRELFPDKEKSVYMRFHQVYHYRNVDQNTLVYYAKQGSDNEILSFQWLIDGKNYYDLHTYIKECDVCMIVASGPSLQKNIDDLKQAKGKAMIFCVDSAAKVLLEHGIVPDVLCTVDPDKGGNPLDDPGLSDIPIAISPESDHRMLEDMCPSKVLCFSAGNAYHKELFELAGCDMPYFDGGGSVATNCFKLAYMIGFRTIILVGQDLAIQDGQIHAGSDKHEQSKWKKLEVDGYYGGKVTTLSDFKLYLDWYAEQIPQLNHTKVINATEGGACISGTIPMPLKKAIELYCTGTFDFHKIYGEIPEIWNTIGKKRELYDSLKEQYDYLEELSGHVSSGMDGCRQALHKYTQKRLTEGDANRLNKTIEEIMHEIENGKASILLYKRMIKTEIEYQKYLYESSRSITNDIDKMETMIKYLNEAYTCMMDMRVLLKKVLDMIASKYHFPKIK